MKVTRTNKKKFFKKKVCRLSLKIIEAIDILEVEKVSKFLTEKGKMVPRRISGNCAKCQRALSRKIKQMRYVGILPFVNNR